jgi:hypothetical protein
VRRSRIVSLGVVIAIVVLWALAIPPASAPLPPVPAAVTPAPRGAVHIHTRRSDGGGTVEQVARAAAGAGLRFVVITDHGNGTRAPDSPAYYGDVLALDAVEISTEGGHVVALGLPKAPYPLGGEARDVVEDVKRLGGFAIAAHPDSLKPELTWNEWDSPVDGLEWLNGDSEWRDESVFELARVLLAYPVRPANALGLLFDRSDSTMHRWDEATRHRRVVALAGADAHARIGARGEDPLNARLVLPLPSYDAVFRAFSVALPQLKLTRDPVADAGAVLGEIRAGHVFSSVDALGVHPAFAFTATSGPFHANGGDTLTIKGPLRFDVVVQGPPDVQIALLRDGTRVLDARGPSLQYVAESGPGAYRVEVSMPNAPGRPPVPWIVSNPIYVGRSETAATASQRPRATQTTALYTDGPATNWSVEHSSASPAAVDVRRAVDGTQLQFRYALSGAPSSHPFAALVVEAGTSLTANDRLTFSAQADRPMRLSVQVRAPGTTADGERWHRSVYLDEKPREISVFFDDMRPRGATSTARPKLDEIRSVLFVVDTVNTASGTAGQIMIDDIRYERSGTDSKQ